MTQRLPAEESFGVEHDSRPVDWPSLLESAIRGDGVIAAYQPIVDVARGTVVGYEALARFTNKAVTNPERWFEAARAFGIADQLEAVAMTAALAARSTLPPNCFLAINVTPDELTQPAVHSVLDSQDDLSGVVIELTEQTQIASYLALEPSLNRYRAAGALIAIDDAGSGYAGLQHLISLQPAIIKLDRQFIDGIDQNETKRALVDMIGTFADRTDCWLLAEGVERLEELAVLSDLGVPLAQGFLLGRPAPPWAGIEPAAADQLPGRRDASRAGTLRDLVEPGRGVTSLNDAAKALAADPYLELVIVVDHHRRPIGAADLESLAIGMASDVMRFNLDTPSAEAGRRSITRPRHSRFQPLVCTDNAGRYAGIVPLERLIEDLAARAHPADRNKQARIYNQDNQSPL